MFCCQFFSWRSHWSANNISPEAITEASYEEIRTEYEPDIAKYIQLVDGRGTNFHKDLEIIIVNLFLF